MLPQALKSRSKCNKLPYPFTLQLLNLAEAQKRVEEMERERQKLDRQLDLAQEKSKKANLGQEVLEAKMKVKIFSPVLVIKYFFVL